MVVLKKWLKAGTIIESMVAITIVTSVLSSALYVVTVLINLNNTIEKIKIITILQKYIPDENEITPVEDVIHKEGGYNLHISYTANDETPNLILGQIELADSNGKTITVFKKYILKSQIK